MQSDLTVKTDDPYRQRVLQGLVEKGIAERLPSLFYVLTPEWMRVKIPTGNEPAVSAVPTEKDPIPDPPKKPYTRPAAIYSNRSHKELIDHILKNY
jgi:hypothetical protein